MGLYFLTKMRDYYKKPKEWTDVYAKVYYCGHQVYSKCTLFEINGRGLAVIQQRFHPVTKHTWWSNIDPWLVYDIWNSAGFEEYFNKHASEPINGLYSTVTVRQIMHGVGLKPMKKEPWETRF